MFLKFATNNSIILGLYIYILFWKDNFKTVFSMYIFCWNLSAELVELQFCINILIINLFQKCSWLTIVSAKFLMKKYYILVFYVNEVVKSFPLWLWLCKSFLSWKTFWYPYYAKLKYMFINKQYHWNCYTLTLALKVLMKGNNFCNTH